MLDSNAFQTTIASLTKRIPSAIDNIEQSADLFSEGLTNQINRAINNTFNLDLTIDELTQQIEAARMNDDVVQRGGVNNDILFGGNADNTLYGLSGDDYLLGGGGRDLLNGGTDRNWLLGDRGQDTLIDSDGGDYMIGGADADVFRLYDWERPRQASILLDFEVGIDTLKIGRLGVTYDSLTFKHDTLGTRIYEQGKEIALLVGVQANELDADSFAFGDLAAAKQEQASLDQTVIARNLPGATKATITPDGFTWKGASGVSNIKTNRKMRPDDIFSIASITKAFTAATVLKLVEAGKITLDDTLGQWLPDIAKEFPGGEKFTIRQLLNGRTGIPSFDTSPGYSAALAAQTSSRDLQKFTRQLSPEKLIEFSYGVPLFTDGPDPKMARASEKWAYTNTSDVLVGFMVEAATGQSFAQLMRENVIDPLGLENTSYGREEPIKGKLARSYLDIPGGADGILDEGEPILDGVPEDITRIDRNLISAFGPAAALFSNAEDTARFTQALFSGELLSEASLKELTDTKATGVRGFDFYGLGVIQVPTAQSNERPFFLSGASLGYLSQSSYSPEQNGAIETFLLNRQFRFEDAVDALSAEAAELSENELSENDAAIAGLNRGWTIS